MTAIAAVTTERSGVVIRHKVDHTKFWGVVYQDSGGPGGGTVWGWGDLLAASIHDPRYCKAPVDSTWRDGPYVQELSTNAELVPVKETRYREVIENVHRELG